MNKIDERDEKERERESHLHVSGHIAAAAAAAYNKPLYIFFFPLLPLYNLLVFATVKRNERTPSPLKWIKSHSKDIKKQDECRHRVNEARSCLFLPLYFVSLLFTFLLPLSNKCLSSFFLLFLLPCHTVLSFEQTFPLPSSLSLIDHRYLRSDPSTPGASLLSAISQTGKKTLDQLNKCSHQSIVHCVCLFSVSLVVATSSVQTVMTNSDPRGRCGFPGRPAHGSIYNSVLMRQPSFSNDSTNILNSAYLTSTQLSDSKVTGKGKCVSPLLVLM